MTDVTHLDSILDDPDSITDMVFAPMSQTDDAWLKHIVNALVRHARSFFREVRLTDQESRRALSLSKRLVRPP